MNTVPALTGRQLIAALEKAGFLETRVRGSHHFLRHVNCCTTVVPVHAGETIGPGLLSKILRDCELSKDDLPDLL